MMKEYEPATPRLVCQIDRLSWRRVPPAGAGLNDLVRIHRIMNQGVRAPDELDQPLAPIRRNLVGAPRSQLVVGHVRHLTAPGGGDEVVAQGGPGMPQPECANVEVVN